MNIVESSWLIKFIFTSLIWLSLFNFGWITHFANKNNRVSQLRILHGVFTQKAHEYKGNFVFSYYELHKHSQ